MSSLKSVTVVCSLLAISGVFTDERSSNFASTTRYWDCCKPSCSWPWKANFSNPVQTCHKNGFSKMDNLNATSGCDGGEAYTCNDNIPWAINDTLAYGFSAADIKGYDESGWCCECYKLQFSTGPISGKTMIVQVTNTVAGFGRSHFNLQIPGAGIGTYDGCTSQWALPRPVWGNRWGGVDYRHECDALPQQIRAGCYFRFDWFQGADNPYVYFSKEKCPPELQSRTQCVRREISKGTSDSVIKIIPRTQLGIRLILGLIMGLMGLVALVGGVTVYYCKRKRRAVAQSMIKSSKSENTLSFSSSSNSDELKLSKKLQFLEVPRSTITISSHVLGQGSFGIVYKATFLNLPYQSDALTVAVKFSTETSRDSDSRFFKECSIMADIGRHLNIVNLLGIVVKGEKMLLLEYCENGSLQKYLKTHRRPFFYHHIDDSGTLLDYDKEKHDFVKQQLSEQKIADKNEFDGRVLSTTDLISFSYQIARGMQFLSRNNIIHRDLAARNVLLYQNLITKISDFGMAVNSKDSSRLMSAMPVRWMAPESICSQQFSEKSDVWSYGVLLWEIFSLGEIPYRELQIKGSGDAFLKMLENGYRLNKPVESFDEMYKLMRKCWSQDCSHRPSFADLRIELQDFISEDYYMNLDTPYEEYNLYLGSLFENN